MKKVPAIFGIILIALTARVAAQTTEWFPTDLTVHPFTSNFLEPRMGVQFGTGKNSIRLDIGNSRDIFRITAEDKTQYSFGADFFTYTRLRGEKDFHFPVEAVDYLFGVNGGYVKPTKDGSYGIRVRFSHISAHLVDGRYDKNSSLWIEGRLPRVYTREFLEFMPYYQSCGLRLYGGFTFVYHVVPDDVKKWMLHGGAEYYVPDAIARGVTPFISCDVRTIALNAVTLNHAISTGVKLGKWNGSGLLVHFTYFKGKNIHGEYYNLDDEYSAIGFNVDL